MATSIFERDGDLFTPTEAALSPWSDQALHGGPPTMLLAREIERFPAEQPMFVTRLTVELMRAVGRTPLAVSSRLLRPGRKVQLIEASLWSGDHEIARATAARIRTAEVVVPAREEPPSHPLPETLTEWTGNWRSGPVYHLLGVEARAAHEIDGIGARAGFGSGSSSHSCRTRSRVGCCASARPRISQTASASWSTRARRAS